MLARPSALALRSRPRRALTTSRERAPAYPASDLPWLCVVGATVASWWRGAWYVMDAALYPDELDHAKLLSAARRWGSTRLGLREYVIAKEIHPEPFIL